MSLITTYDLAKSFGPEDIFSGVALSIPPRARIGLVGSNGIGKTTLLRILAGLDEPSSGRVTRARNLRMGYLPQNAALDSKVSLWEECLKPFEGLVQRQKELAQMESSMSRAGQDHDTLLETYGRLQDQFERLGGYTYENRIQQILTGLGFSKTDLRRPLTQLSGGQRTRAFLGKLLLSDPDLLLLDEPTNHLDIEAIEWLEAYLGDWRGAVLLVSHDRYFLNQVVDTIWEMTPAIEIYHGNYSAYLDQRQERYTRRLAEYQEQQEFIEKEEEFIRRNMAGQNTRQAQGRRKRLERLLEETQLVRPVQSRRLHLHLQSSGRSGDLVLRTYNLTIGYADEGRPLFHTPDLTLLRGECAAVLGPNGAGKTTFLKTLLEQIPPLGGEAQLGAGLKVGYFAQAHEGLHLDWTLMDEINAVAPAMLPAQVRDYLAQFLFTGDDVFKQVGVLSGGERGRLALACLALQGANLLLLDEPTNHLDLPSQEVLQTILSDFKGTILLVSHDRYLIDALATQIWEVRPGHADLTLFKGSYSEYKASQAATQDTPAALEPVRRETPRSRSGGLSKHELRRLEEKLQALEKRIAELEEQMAAITRQLENPPPDAARVQRLAQDYQSLQDMLEEHLQEWEKLSQSIETAVTS